MIPYTLTKNGIEEKRQVKTSWAEVSLSDYVNIYTEPSQLDSACVLCGLSMEEYVASGGILDGHIGYALEMVQEGVSAPRPDWLAADLSQDIIGRFELAKKYLLNATLHHCQAFPYFYAIYCWPDEYDTLDSLVGEFPVELFWRAAKLPIREVIGACQHILSEIQRLTEKYAPVLENAVTAEQLAAGLERFEKFGFFPTLLSNTGGDLARLSKVLKVNTGVFFHSLWVSTEKAGYEREYNQLMSRKH